MGSSESKPAPADLDIYICGIIIESTYYRMIKNIFPNYDQSLNNKIQLTKRDQSYYLNYEYQYEYRFLKQTIRNIENEEKVIKYNSFIFRNINIDESFSKVLSFYLYEYDVHNKRKNVIISFANQILIKRAFEELTENFSSETQPILILIDDNREYNEKLDYLNYIPGLKKIKNDLLKKNDKNLTNDMIHQIAENLFITYLRTKLFRICAYYNEMGYNLNMINPLNEINAKIQFHATIALVGESGCGKSTLLNFVFNELVTRVNTTSEDVTKKCSEYYLPVKEVKNKEKVGQLRLLDFPGLKEQNNYKYVEDEINNKIEKYKKKNEQIDIALLFINTQGRIINDTFKKMIKLLHENHIKIIFIMNGTINEKDVKKRKQSLKNAINDNSILNNEYKNWINCDYKLEYDNIRRNGLSKIFHKINEIIKKNIIDYDIEKINEINYKVELKSISENNRLFESYDDINKLIKSKKAKSITCVSFYSFLSLGFSTISIFVPVVDSVLVIGFQTAMVFNLLYIYDENPVNYDKTQIILSNGKIIIKNENFISHEFDEIENLSVQISSELTASTTNEIIKNAGKQVALQTTKEVTKETTKQVVIEATKEITIEASKEVAKQSSKEATKEILIKTSKQFLQQSVKEIGKDVIEETGKQMVTIGIEQTAKEVAKETIVEGATIATKEGIEEVVEATTKETIKQVSENVVASQGSKVWLTNLGKAVPFIGAAISGVINTYSTALTGHRMIQYLEKMYEYDEKRVQLIKARILVVKNIIEQVDKIIEEQENINNLNKLIIE